MAMAETNKKLNLPLNPNAPEFIPSNPFPLYPKHKPFGGWFCHRRNLPPRMLNYKRVWVPKSFPRKPLPKKDKTFLAGKTSVMLRNIPNDLGRSDLLRILDNHCRRENRQEQTPSSYDVLYLPMDFVKHANLGYAFVNFTTSIAAERFYREFHNLSWNHYRNCTKTCKITLAKFQGKQELRRHFNHSNFTCHTDDYLPVLLSPASDGFTAYRLTTLGRRVAPA